MPHPKRGQLALSAGANEAERAARAGLSHDKAPAVTIRNERALSRPVTEIPSLSIALSHRSTGRARRLGRSCWA